MDSTGNINGLKSLVSFQPLLSVLKDTLHKGSTKGAQKLYSGILEYADKHTELLKPIEDISVLQKHQEWMEMLLSILFPPTVNESEALYSVAIPFSGTSIYASSLFRKFFIRPGTNEIILPDIETEKIIERGRLVGAYNLVLRKYCNYRAPYLLTSVRAVTDNETGLTNYLELQMDTHYVDIKFTGSQLPIPDDFINHKNHSLLTLEEMQQAIPLDQFVFEGIVIGKVINVTEREVISQMKSELHHLNAFSEIKVYQRLEELVQVLIGSKDIRIGITPFFKVNGHYVFSEMHNSNSLLFKHHKAIKERDKVSDYCHEVFMDTEKMAIYETIEEEVVKNIGYLKYYYEQGYRSMILAPLKHNGDLWGLLEVGSDKEGTLDYRHANKLEVAIPIFTRAIEKSAEALDTQIDKVIKHQFTVIQSVVEWKFTEVAYNFIIKKQEGHDPKMERIAFEALYPLYGAIDLRNSSVERSQAIQLDYIEQLQMTSAIIVKAQGVMNFPLLQEIQFKIDKHLAAVSKSLQSEEESAIEDFLQNQITSIFNHLRATIPALSKDIESYFAALDNNIGMIYHHRKDFEDSISKINEVLSKFVDREQVTVQQVYPHYFERYVTDGVEFNIYIGQNLAPRKKFDELYLRNMKMWQLTTLAKAARIAKKLSREVSHPLQTTQLILVHSTPISISFRADERKFDMDGAYNIRYEIIKKRIDKVHIKETNERLTQPGKIAIVYTQQKNADEYAEYIEFLQNQGLLKPGIDYYDLEELQGVVGLKGMRVDIQYEEEEETADKKPELSTTTDEQLLKGKMLI